MLAVSSCFRFIWTLKADSNHCAFHRSTPSRMVVRWRGCGTVKRLRAEHNPLLQVRTDGTMLSMVLAIIAEYWRPVWLSPRLAPRGRGENSGLSTPSIPMSASVKTVGLWGWKTLATPAGLVLSYRLAVVCVCLWSVCVCVCVCVYVCVYRYLFWHFLNCFHHSLRTRIVVGCIWFWKCLCLCPASRRETNSFLLQYVCKCVHICINECMLWIVLHVIQCLFVVSWCTEICLKRTENKGKVYSMDLVNFLCRISSHEFLR